MPQPPPQAGFIGYPFWSVKVVKTLICKQYNTWVHAGHYKCRLQIHSLNPNFQQFDLTTLFALNVSLPKKRLPTQLVHPSATPTLLVSHMWLWHICRSQGRKQVEKNLGKSKTSHNFIDWVVLFTHILMFLMMKWIINRFKRKADFSFNTICAFPLRQELTSCCTKCSS